MPEERKQKQNSLLLNLFNSLLRSEGCTWIQWIERPVSCLKKIAKPAERVYEKKRDDKSIQFISK